jgi:hypothetical protein
MTMYLRLKRLPTERSLPIGSTSWSRYTNLPRTHHQVPDIA